MNVRSLMITTAAAIAGTACAVPAFGVTTPTQTSPTSYFFGGANFNDEIDFSGLTAGSLVRISLTGTSDADFTSATAAFNSDPVRSIAVNGPFFGGMFTTTAVSGINSLLLSAVTAGTGSYSGTLTVLSASVPEASTWAMMTIGFGALGYALRRRRTAFSIA